jgi:hypothetical protein
MALAWALEPDAFKVPLEQYAAPLPLPLPPAFESELLSEPQAARAKAATTATAARRAGV